MPTEARCLPWKSAVADVSCDGEGGGCATTMFPPVPAGIDMDIVDPRVKRLFTLPSPAQRSEEWLAMRRGLLTASDAAAALDIKPYPSFAGSPRADLLKKKAQQSIGIQTFHGNSHTQHGEFTRTSKRIRLHA